MRVLIDPVSKQARGVKFRQGGLVDTHSPHIVFPRREGSVYTVLADREVIMSAGALNTPQVGRMGCSKMTDLSISSC